MIAPIEQFIKNYEIINLQAYEIKIIEDNSVVEPIYDFIKVYDKHFISIIVHENSLNSITIDNIAGSIYPSWQIVATGLDSATATFTLQKSNTFSDYGDIPSASGTFAAGNSVRFIEFANPFNNSAFKLNIVVNTVTVGTLRIDVNIIRP